MVIISSELSEEDILNAIDKITQFITQKGGNIIGVERWGRRKLAYPIKHHGEGDYVVAQIELEPSKARELEGKFRLSEEYLRHLLIRLGA
jgi:small subunit ribosomal protein S6